MKKTIESRTINQKLRKCILAGIVVTSLSSCIDILNPELKFLVPPLITVYEGEEYSYQTQVSSLGKKYYSLEEAHDACAPDWIVPLSINKEGLVKGESPFVEGDKEYHIILRVSRRNDSDEQDYLLRVIDTDR